MGKGQYKRGVQLPAKKSFLEPRSISGKNRIRGVSGLSADCSQQPLRNGLQSRRVALAAGGNSCRVAYFAANQISAIGATSLVYDANGNLTQDALYAYSYDEENRLVQVNQGATVLGQYAYDALGRRIQKIAGGVTTVFFYDGSRIIEDQNASWATQATYVYGNYVDELLQMKRSSNSYYYHQNTLFSVAALTDSTGAVVERYAYDAYGAPSAVSTVGNRYMFTGREYESETGLYHYRARAYDPGKGRFIQRDPIGFDAGDANLYRYVSGNPVFWVDPSGNRKECTIAVFVGHCDVTPNFMDEKNKAWDDYEKKRGSLVPKKGKATQKNCPACNLAPEAKKYAALGCWTGDKTQGPGEHRISDNFPQPYGVVRIGKSQNKDDNAGYPDFDSMMKAVVRESTGAADKMADNCPCDCQEITVVITCQPQVKDKGAVDNNYTHYLDLLNQSRYCNMRISTKCRKWSPHQN